MIVWSGWGILTVAFGFIGLIAAVMGAEALSNALHLAQPLDPSISIAVGLLLAAGQNHLFTRWREQGDPRVFVDEATGQRIEVRPTAGSLFFVPMRYWTWIALALAALVALIAVYDRLT
ncbi:MAG: hypothetical protein JNM59_02140 [Hyphomonadaceae bacterium]|nr:hypothetical protein [Hyphomonadaceae bacterium]